MCILTRFPKPSWEGKWGERLEWRKLCSLQEARMEFILCHTSTVRLFSVLPVASMSNHLILTTSQYSQLSDDLGTVIREILPGCKDILFCELKNKSRANITCLFGASFMYVHLAVAEILSSNYTGPLTKVSSMSRQLLCLHFSKGKSTIDILIILFVSNHDILCLEEKRNGVFIIARFVEILTICSQNSTSFLLFCSQNSTLISVGSALWDEK